MSIETNYLEQWFEQFDSFIPSFTNLTCVVVSAVVYRGKYEQTQKYTIGPILGISIDFTTNLLDFCVKKGDEEEILWYEPIIWIKPLTTETIYECHNKIKSIMSRFTISSFKTDPFGVNGSPYYCYEYSPDVINGLINFPMDHGYEYGKYIELCGNKHLAKLMTTTNTDYIDHFKKRSGVASLYVLSNAKIHSLTAYQINFLNRNNKSDNYHDTDDDDDFNAHCYINGIKISSLN